ncbi:MAG: hypothetical protein RBT76_01015 [candidate division Zixibacteria bacterium]|nr:hypothetical protein [candidate division Zixibacteria bacterium]
MRKWFAGLIAFFFIGNVLLFYLFYGLASLWPRAGMWLLTTGKLVLLILLFLIPAGGVLIARRGCLLKGESSLRPLAWAVIFIYLLVPASLLVAVR